MFSDIKLYQPDFYIECYKYNTAGAVYQQFRDNGIVKAYVYGMVFKRSPILYDFLKVGLSCPELADREHQVGERVVRQVAWVPGWDSEVSSPSGFDLWNGIQRLIKEERLPSNFNKNHLGVAVWDITHRVYTQADDLYIEGEMEATKWAEGHLAQQYFEMNGQLPPLNHQNPANSKSYKKGYISKTSFNNLFDDNQSE
jgi:hypothetical protein